MCYRKREQVEETQGMGWLSRNWTLFSILILTMGAGWVAFTPPPATALSASTQPAAPQEGFPAPDFTLFDANGTAVHLADFRGQVVVLNLWASWCGPCQAEMPAIQHVSSAYAPKGLVVLAVNTTFQDQKKAVLAFVEKNQLTFPILFDDDGAVSRSYQIRSMPTTFFIDADGMIRRVVIGGPMPEAFVQSEVERLLQKAR